MKFHNVLRTSAIVVALTAFGAAPAFADSTTPSPSQVLYSESNSNVSATVLSAGTATSQYAGKVVLVDEHVKAVPKPKVPKKHKLTKVEKKYGLGCTLQKKFWNSGESANGQIFWFQDTNGVLCPDKHSPTGLVKVAGGKTGRDCHNEAKLDKSPPPKKVQVSTVRVVMLPSWSYTVTIHAVASVEGIAVSQASCTVNGASASSTAYGSFVGYASIDITVTGKTVTAAQNAATSQVPVSSLQQQASQSAFTGAVGQVSTSASAFCFGATSQTTFSCPLGSTTNNAGTACVKDGSTTPLPIANPNPGGTSTPPGPNPIDTNPVSSQCYDPTTGNPVPVGTPGAWCS